MKTFSESHGAGGDESGVERGAFRSLGEERDPKPIHFMMVLSGWFIGYWWKVGGRVMDAEGFAGRNVT